MEESLAAQLRTTLNTVPAFTWYSVPSGTLTFVNHRYADYLGLASDHPLRFGVETGVAWDTHLQLLHPDDHESSRTIGETILRTGSAGQAAFRVRDANGVYRWFLSRVEPFRASDETVLGFIGINLDIEDHKRVEDALRRSEHSLAEAQRLSHVGSVGMQVSTKRIFWSEESARIYGYAPGTEPTPAAILQRVHPEDVGLVTDAIERAGMGGADFEFEHRLLMPDGSIRHIYNLSHRYQDEAGHAEVLGAIMDVTGRRVAEEAIRRSEAYLAEAQRLSHTGSFGWKPEDGEVVWSDETYRIFEYDRTLKPTVDSVVHRVHPDDKALAQQIIDSVSQTGTDFEHECRLLLPDGRVKQVHSIAHAVQNASGRREFIGAVTDITERKTAEEQIRQQEMERQQMLDLTPLCIAVIGPDWRPLYANRASLDYFGVSLDVWLQKGQIGDEAHPDDRERLMAEGHRASLTGSPFELEVRVRKGDGSFRWFQSRFNPLHDDKGQVTRWFMASTDIDDRKRAEETLQQENVALREEIDKTNMFEEIVGTSPALTAVLSRVSKVAGSDSTVFISGETGTGKELVARAIHRLSRRASRAFVAVNCAAIPRDLIASELFGHEKGAFTGAVQRRLGRFELAHGGTIFLDEVGELSPDIQVALLRVLQEREFERVGGRGRIQVDVRVIAATNRDLAAAVTDGTFRPDLFYRLNVFPLEMPALRERRQDIPVLVEYFIGRYARRAGKTFRRVAKRTLDRLQSYPWPGNVRELQNVIERSVIVSDTDEFAVDDSWLATTHPVESRLGLSGALAAHEKAIVEDALRASDGRVFGPAGAAARLGIPRSTLEARIRTLKINKSRFRTKTPTHS